MRKLTEGKGTSESHYDAIADALAEGGIGDMLFVGGSVIHPVYRQQPEEMVEKKRKSFKLLMKSEKWKELVEHREVSSNYTLDSSPKRLGAMPASDPGWMVHC